MPSTTSEEYIFLSLFKDEPTVRDRRRSCRRPASTVAILRQVAKAERRNPIYILVIDVSEGGLGLRSPIALRRGGTYGIQTEQGEAHHSWQVKVVSIRRRRDGSYDVGTRHIY